MPMKRTRSTMWTRWAITIFVAVAVPLAIAMLGVQTHHAQPIPSDPGTAALYVTHGQTPHNDPVQCVSHGGTWKGDWTSNGHCSGLRGGG